MSSSSKDYYSGFEGEPELTFTRSDGAVFRVWEGFFSWIMAAVDPGPNGWHGLARPYHLLLWDENPYDVTDLPESVAQLREVSPNRLDQDARDQLLLVLSDLVEFLEEAAKVGHTVSVVRD